MAENETVSKDLCKVIHKEVDRRLDNLDSCIKEIKDAVSEMREIAAGTKEIINMLLEERKVKPISKFWDTKAGQLIPWLGFAIIIIIIAALVGTNLIEGWQQVKDYIPKG